MKRSTRSFVGKVLRSGKRLFADPYDVEAKRVRIVSVAFVDNQVKNIKVIDCGVEIDDGVQRENFKLGEFKKLKVNGTYEVMGIDEKKGGIELGESKELRLVVDDDDDDGHKVSRIKRFGVVYTRKRKRNVMGDSCLKLDGFDVDHGSDKMSEKKNKKVRISLQSGFDGNYVLRKGPVVFAVSCSYESSDRNSISSSICRYSCFVSTVLRYLRMTKLFTWRQFSSFLLLEPSSSIYLSTGSRFLQDSTYSISHGLFKVFGSFHSIPSFTVNFISLPLCFLYIHSNIHLKHEFFTSSFIKHPTDKNTTSHDLKTSSFCILDKDPPLDKLVVAKKARSSRKRVPRVSLFNNISQCNAQLHVKSIVPVPGVREIEGYAEEDYVPFMLPESYISSRSDELSRTMEKSCVIYDMDSDDEQWLKNYNNECVSEDTFEKIIDAFERGVYCSPHDYSEAASAVARCLELAPKEVLDHVYSYWMTKRKKKRSALIRVFQCYKQKRVKRRFTSAVIRKKRSFRRRASQRVTEKQLDFKKAMLNDEKLLEESTKACIKVHETQEAAKRLEEASIVKRQQAQALMEAADLAVYRATMALRIAEARAVGDSFDLLTGPIFGSSVE